LMINDLGALTHKINDAAKLVDGIKTNFSLLQIANLQLQTAYLIWQKPFMTIGGDTFINDMMKHCCLQNIFENNTRYPEITLEQLSKSNCELILLSSEPYPFKQQHVDELQKIMPGKKIILVDGEMFSWYGSRLLLAPGYFKSLLTSIGY
jgi:ABC-type Fe3+-hydroxamate transport system substrate-binding protein